VQPIASVHGILFQGNRVLLIRRGHEPNRGRWSLPGGKIELGESLAEAIKREFAEETSLEVRLVRFVDTAETIVRDEDGRIRFHYVGLCCLVEELGGRLLAGSDASEASWFSSEELSALDMHQTARRIVEAAFVQRGIPTSGSNTTA